MAATGVRTFTDAGTYAEAVGISALENAGVSLLVTAPGVFGSQITRLKVGTGDPNDD